MSTRIPTLSPDVGKIVFAPVPVPPSEFDCLRGRVIVLEGVMGTGKSLLGRSIVHYLTKKCDIPARFYEEYVNKDLLDMYLKDPARYAFSFQVIMVQKRIDRYVQEILPFIRTGGVAVVDRFIMGDISFEMAGYKRGHISAEEHKVYWGMLKRLEAVPAPDYQVYLECRPDEGLKRIAHRGNTSEISSYKPEHMVNMDVLHRETFALCGADIVVVDYNESLYIKGDGHLRWRDVSRVIRSIMSSSGRRGVVPPLPPRSAEVL